MLLKKNENIINKLKWVLLVLIVVAYKSSVLFDTGNKSFFGIDGLQFWTQPREAGIVCEEKAHCK